MTPTNEAGHGLPELPRAIGLICGRRLTPEGTREFFGLFYEDREMGLKEQVYTADQMHQYARDAASLSRGVPDGGPGDCVDMARAWLAVTDTLNEVFPQWIESNKVGRECACDAIRYLAERARIAAAPAAAGAQGEECAASVSERARELLAAECGVSAGMVNKYQDRNVIARVALRAIEKALSQQGAATVRPDTGGHALPGDDCPLCKAIGGLTDLRHGDGGHKRIHCAKCGKGSFGLHPLPGSTTPQPAAADGGVRERARELLAKAERGPQNDYGTVHRRIAHAAIAEALSSHRQAGEPDAYIESYEVDGNLRQGLVWADHPANTHGSTFVPLYTAPPPGAELSKFRELAERWRTSASVCGETEYSDGARDAFSECATAVLALVEKGAG